jgi:hypothetical protein
MRQVRRTPSSESGENKHSLPWSAQEEVMNPALLCRGPTPVTRRELLQVGTIGALGLSLPGLLRAEARTGTGSRAATADSCILVFLNGGPSHLDMWDMKPSAPFEIRGPFKPIATTTASIVQGPCGPGWSFSR